MKHPEPFLRHILDEIQYLIKNSKIVSYEELITDETLKRSFVRSLEIIGEATKNLPPSFRKKYPQVDWKKIAGLRDVLIHKYFVINYEAVWDIIKNQIPELKEKIETLLKEVEDNKT